MTFTGLTLHYAVKELSNELPARFQKIQQLSPYQLLFQMKGNHAFKWFLDLTPQTARMHKTHLDFPHKAALSNITQRLKKWLIGAKLKRVHQHGIDRVVEVIVEGRNALFEATTYHLFLEFFGKDANLIVTDGSLEILDLLKPTSQLFNHPRILHIGAPYTFPPKTKASPFDEAAVKDYLEKKDTPVHNVFEGFSKKLGEAFAEGIHDAAAWFKRLENPVFAIEDGQFTMFDSTDESMTFSDWADQRLTQIFADKPYDNALKSLQKTLQKKREKATKKATALRAQLAGIKDSDRLTHEGQLIMLDPSKHEKKARTEVIDYTTGDAVTFKLDPTKTVLENANARFKKAKKLKLSRPHITKQLKITERLRHYLDSILDQLDYADPKALDEIRRELMDAKIIKSKTLKKPQGKAKPKRFTVDGSEIYVGQNHMQNAELTHRFAKRTWWFLHARGVPGAHVIIAHETPSNRAKEAAAQLAAFHSKHRGHPKAEVDYVEVKHLKKIKGHPASLVTYDDYETLIVPGDMPQVTEKKSL